MAKIHRELALINSADHLCIHSISDGMTPSHEQHSALACLEEDLLSPKGKNNFCNYLGVAEVSLSQEDLSCMYNLQPSLLAFCPYSLEICAHLRD